MRGFTAKGMCTNAFFAKTLIWQIGEFRTKLPNDIMPKFTSWLLLLAKKQR